MTEKEQKKAAKQFSEHWKDRGSEKSDTQKFWDSLLHDVYGLENYMNIIEYEKPVTVDGNSKYIDGYIHDESLNIIIEQKSFGINLNEKLIQSDNTLLTSYEQAKRYDDNLNKNERADYIITCNFSDFFIYNMNDLKAKPVQIKLSELPEHYHLMNFFINKKATIIKKEERISIAAGKIIGKMYDMLLKQYENPNSSETLNNLNILCVRLVFCFYAEDSGVFKHSLFQKYMSNIPTNRWHRELTDLFKILDTEEDKRSPYDDSGINEFPWVNGKLFRNTIEIPRFTEEIKNIILNEACEFDWKTISPTIFGAFFESTLNPEKRHDNGMHYTSVENIHKVIDPLFLNELNEEFQKISVMKKRNIRNAALKEFQKKLASLNFLDPACGSGNFLTETYLSLRKLENKVIRILRENDDEFRKQCENQLFINMTGSAKIIKVSLEQFNGIEISDFAVSVAKTAMWIAESQSLNETQDIIGSSLPYLPLKTSANIIKNNALHINWEDVILKDKLNYIMGNPPFNGARTMSESQKNDVMMIFKGTKNNGNLDYVSCWYKKSVELMKDTKIHAALVSTNSISQGEQIQILWKPLIEMGTHIDFAYRTFQWDSEAYIKAHVHCIVIGFSLYENDKPKIIYDGEEKIQVKHISPYIKEDAEINIVINRRKTPICNVPHLITGSMPNDCNGCLSKFSNKQILEITKNHPDSIPFFKKFIGAYEYLNNKERYCLWLKDVPPQNFMKIKPIMELVNKVKTARENSKRPGTKKAAEYPHLFAEIRQPDSNYLVYPSHSTNNRKYIPIGYMPADVICGNANQMIPNATLYHFGILISKVYVIWIKEIGGKLKSDPRNSVDIVYNNFPWCNPTDKQKANIEKTAQAILDARDKYPNCSLADMYGDKMYLFPELCKAHKDNDNAVMDAYGFSKNTTESECITKLKKMYKKLVEQ